MSTCQVPDCPNPATRTQKTVCEMHYYRMRRTGTYAPRPKADRPQTNPVPSEPCSIAGCERRARRRCGGRRVCALHGQRWDRYGRFDRIKQSAHPRPRRGVCIVDGCEKADDGPHGLCKMHKSRLDRHGDVTVAIPQRERALPRGEAHPQWTGDAASYTAVHQRIKRAHGAPSKRTCADCGGKAAHWSYNHDDPQERTSELGPYSLDAGHYSPRCVRCHKRFDMAYLRESA